MMLIRFLRDNIEMHLIRSSGIPYLITIQEFIIMLLHKLSLTLLRFFQCILNYKNPGVNHHF